MTEQDNLEELVNGMETRCFTYEVQMVIQIFGRTEAEAKEKLDRDGGYISQRKVRLKDTVQVYSGDTQESTDLEPKPEEADADKA
jgi:hypothetical protein